MRGHDGAVPDAGGRGTVQGRLLTARGAAGEAAGWPSAATRLAAIIGDPVDHSLSPVIHNAAFAALGLDWVYLALPVRPDDVVAAVAGLGALGVAGVSVTMPHKAAVAAALGDLSPTARRLGAVNTLVRRGKEMAGESTDGAGFLASLAADQAWVPARSHCVVLGAGGAARSVVLALAEAGAATVSVVARDAGAARRAAELAGSVGRVAGIDAVAGAALVVNATPVGMGSSAGHLPFGLDPGRLAPGQLVVDLVYAPAVTALVQAARSRGAETANGLGTLVHQAGMQFQLWTGREPPLDVMAGAARDTLAARSAGNEATGNA